MQVLTRREFVKSALATPAAAGMASRMAAAAPLESGGPGQVTLGSTGITASRVAMGTGFNGFGGASNQTRLGRAAFRELILYGYEKGLNFFDMADQYGSHHFMREVLREVPREKVTLLSKIWFSGGGGLDPTDRAVPSVERFLRELEVDYLDICLIHCVQEAGWPEDLARMRDELSQLKDQGRIRAVGVSCHSFQALAAAVESPWTEVIFARINNRGEAMDRKDPDPVASLLLRARERGKAVVGMKIFGAGKLTTGRQREESINYVWRKRLVDAMTIGFEQKSQIDDCLRILKLASA